MKKTLFAVMLALALVLIPVGSAFAATTADVDVTATPAILSITNAPEAWDINNVAFPNGTGMILHNDTYWSNNLDNNVAPTVGGALATECRFAVTNNGDIIADVEVTFPDFDDGGTPPVVLMPNNNDGAATADNFGAKVYRELDVPAAYTFVESTGTPAVFADMDPTDIVNWGLQVATKTTVFTVDTPMQAVVTLTAEESL